MPKVKGKGSGDSDRRRGGDWELGKGSGRYYTVEKSGDAEEKLSRVGRGRI